MRRAKFAVDNTSSVNVLLLSKRGKRMRHKIKVEFEGVTAECETAEAAARLMHELKKGIRPPSLEEWSLDEFQEFVGRIGITQRRWLACLLRRADKTSDADIRAEI